MCDRNDVIYQIEDLLGSEGDHDLAVRVYERLRADDRVYFDDAEGLTLAEGVDLIAVAGEVLAE